VKKFEIPAKLNMRLNLSNPKYHASTNLEYGGYSKAEIQTMSDATDILAAIKKAAGEKAEVELVATKPPVGFQFKTNHFEVKKANAAQLIELISVTPTSGTAKVLGS
jgi:hypothetical protein